MQPGADDLCYSSAVELVRLMRQKQVSARDVMAAHLARIERVNPKVNAIVTLVAERAMADAARADEQLAARRRGGRASRAAGRAQGSRGHGRHPHDARLAVLSRQRADDATRSSSRGIRAAGADHARQDEHAGVRRRVADVQHGLRRDAQSVRPDEDVRRQQRRRGGGAGLRHGADRRRQRHRRVASQSGGLLQRRRLPAVAGPRAAASRASWSPLSVSGPMARSVADVALFLSAIAGPDPRSPLSIHEDGARFARATRPRASRARASPGGTDSAGFPFEPEIRAGRRRDPPTSFEDLGCIVEEAEPDFTGVDEAFRDPALRRQSPAVRGARARAARVGEGHDQVRGRARRRS